MKPDLKRPCSGRRLQCVSVHADLDLERVPGRCDPIFVGFGVVAVCARGVVLVRDLIVHADVEINHYLHGVNITK